VSERPLPSRSGATVLVDGDPLSAPPEPLGSVRADDRAAPRRHAGAVTRAVFLALTLFLAQPLRAPVPVDKLDADWITGLHLAQLHNLRFGADVVFTQGPWGWLTNPMLTDSRVLSVAGSGAFAVVAIVLLWCFVESRLRASVGDLAGALLSCLLVSILFQVSTASWTLLLALVGYALGRLAGSPRTSLWFIGGCAVAASGLLQVKFSEGLLAMALTGVLVVRRLTWSAGAVAVAAVLSGTGAAWMAAGQQLNDLVPWLRYSAEVTGGYQGAMYYQVPGAVMGWVLAATLAMVLVLSELTVKSKGIRSRVPLWLGMAGVVFFGFKQGFVRHDFFHEFALYSMLVPVFLMRAGRTRSGALAAAGLVLAVFGILHSVVIGATPTSWQTSARTVASGDHRQHRVEQAKSSLRETYDVAPAILQRLQNRPVVIDPIRIGVAWAHDLDWRPVPVLQAYSGYTPSLDRLDARSLLEDPRTAVLREEQSVDDRLSLWDGPLYNLTLLCHFRETVHDARWTLFERSADRCSAPRDVSVVQVHEGRAVALPPVAGDQLLTMRFEPHTPPLGRRLTTLLWRDPSPLSVSIGGRQHRLPRALAGGPLVVRMPDWARWPTSDLTRPSGNSIVFSESGRLAFQLTDVAAPR
jgi:hypothetical protein